MSDLLHAEGQEVVPPENLEGAEPEQLKHDANMSVVLEPVQHPHAGAEIMLLAQREEGSSESLGSACSIYSQSAVVIQAVDLLQHSDLRLGRLPETLHVADDLHGHAFPSVEHGGA